MTTRPIHLSPSDFHASFCVYPTPPTEEEAFAEQKRAIWEKKYAPYRVLVDLSRVTLTITFTQQPDKKGQFTLFQQGSNGYGIKYRPQTGDCVAFRHNSRTPYGEGEPMSLEEAYRRACATGSDFATRHYYAENVKIDGESVSFNQDIIHEGEVDPILARDLMTYSEWKK